MSNIIDFNQKKQQMNQITKESAKSGGKIRPTLTLGRSKKIEGNLAQLRDETVNDRIQRIQTSLDKIQTLIAGIKKLERKDD